MRSTVPPGRHERVNCAAGAARDAYCAAESWRPKKCRAVKPGINVAFLIGHNDIRRAIMGMSDNAPTAEQLGQMRSLVAQGMHDGAFGLSTGLLYLPGTYSGIDEVVALSQAAADSGGIYTSHLRKEGLGLLDGVAEALEIGRRARIPVMVESLMPLPRVPTLHECRRVAAAPLAPAGAPRAARGLSVPAR